jgi:hypothetical protein
MSDLYRERVSAHYQAHVMGIGNVNDAISSLKELATDTRERALMRARHSNLKVMSTMFGDSHHQRDYTGHIELIALDQVFPQVAPSLEDGAPIV